MASITLEKLTKQFGAQTAVDSLDMAIADGELLVLLGPSGCGKTTTMNCIAGLERPTGGVVRFDGNDMTGEPPHGRNVAMVFQSSMLYPHLSARENIAMSLKRSGLPAAQIRDRVMAAAATVHVAHLLDKLPSHLSGGERQRVATAKAIVRQPAVFLLDEPLAALDAALRLELRAELVNLQKRLSTTMVFVTHDQTEAMTMGDRIAVMNLGRLQQIGSPDEIYNAPRNMFVAGFIGSPPMNFLNGTVEPRDGKPVFVSDGFAAPLPARLGASSSLRPGNAYALGVRPQHMTVAGATPGTLAGAVFALEHLGKESILIAEHREGERLRAIVAPEFRARIGDRIALEPDLERAFLFDLGVAERPAVS
ncbi:MAG: ABC transporter ATP-binding protein [Alphaproteobacteria bacterium]